MTKTYAIKERFRTVQGEGYYAGTPALFIRFAGCNMWSGHEEDRDRDAVRNEAHCPRWCDTDFVGGEKTRLDQILDFVEASKAVPMIVLTGGEPMLQVDEELLVELARVAPEARIAIETNGTVKPKWNYPEASSLSDPRFWITLSPKQRRARIVLPWANEIKLVWPDYDPAEWTDYPADHWFVQPRADRTIRDEVNEREAALYVSEGYRWRLSLQTHKITRMR